MCLQTCSSALEGHGLQVRSELTRDLDHARELAREACVAGETVVCLSGDGMVGAVADVLREIPMHCSACYPAGVATTSRAFSAFPPIPSRLVRSIAAGFSRKLDLGEVDTHTRPPHGAHTEEHTQGAHAWQASGKAFVGIASVGFDSEANRIANEAPAWLGGLVYAYGALRALLFWRPARFEIELDPPR